MFENWIIHRNDAFSAPYANLEQQFLMEFFINDNIHMIEMQKMSSTEAAALMGKACRHASLKLAALESAKRFREIIRKD